MFAFGGTERQFDRSLERLCEALASAGVDGVVKVGDQVATQQQEVAVDTLLDNGAVTFDDLALLPPD